MRSLLELQRDFAGALLGAGGAPHMAVYRGNVFGNWHGALAGAYPVVRRIVGEAFFEAMARDYARAHPSEDGDLNEYGAPLARFFETYPETLDLPYLPDVARLEWLAHRAYFAADAAPFDFARPTEARLAPACGLLESAWPVASIWEAHQENGRPERVNLGSGPERALVHRPDGRVEASVLRPGDFRFLACLQAGDALGAALEAAVAEDAGFVPRVALAAWVQAGVLTQ
ncbi:MAG: putative DNA-binding domain-containing protein [Betaproteobacteria bacterium]|nr:putative DNA-binding domain-containing protein [Betaproteobacteria bacterium]